MNSKVAKIKARDRRWLWRFMHNFFPWYL